MSQQNSVLKILQSFFALTLDLIIIPLPAIVVGNAILNYGCCEEYTN